MLAPTWESASTTEKDLNGLYVKHWGMASSHASESRNSKGRTKEKRTAIDIARETLRDHSEGSEPKGIRFKPGQESVSDVVRILMNGVRSACTYSGATNLKELYNLAEIILQSPSGHTEGGVTF